MSNSKYIAIAFIALFISCKIDKKETPKEQTKDLSVLEKIANAHGFENWKSVEEINFTFNVDRDSTHFERSWTWNPRNNGVISISGTDTLKYNRATMDTLAIKANAGFINDRYWLLAPFNLIWDGDNFTHEHIAATTAPISNQPMQKLTIVYGDEGGYTPGDAYDFYFNDDFLIREWVFRKGNQEEPSTMTTWENYTDINGFKLALDHKRPGENFNLYFTGVELKMKE